MKNKKGLMGIVVAVVIVAVMVFAYTQFAPKASEGSKSIRVEVRNSADEVTVYPLTTDAEYLEQAFYEIENLEITNEEGPYGMFIAEVNGERAVYEENGAYWSITVNGEYGMYGASEQVVNDGDVFGLVYAKG